MLSAAESLVKAKTETTSTNESKTEQKENSKMFGSSFELAMTADDE